MLPMHKHKIDDLPLPQFLPTSLYDSYNQPISSIQFTSNIDQSIHLTPYHRYYSHNSIESNIAHSKLTTDGIAHQN